MSSRSVGEFSSKAVGMQYEERAVQYLAGCGYRVVARNYRCRKGEIDIIAKDGPYLCFIEVKYRKEGKFGGALKAVNLSKQQRISKTALYYLMEHGYTDNTPCRFDVLGVTADHMELIKNAFEFRG